MAHIPKSVLDKCPTIPSLTLRRRGKVRDSHDLPGHPDKMLVVASDRLSIFDFVLPTLVTLKGAILTALNHFWLQTMIGQICETDFIASGAAIDPFLPEELRDNPKLQKCATVVKLVATPTVEDIVRLYLTGSGWKSYQETGMVCGHKLPTGLIDGSKLPYPIYTPTTKATKGHDEHITADSVAAKWGVGCERQVLQVAMAIANYAETCGIIMADTKLEGHPVLADEKGTPDSSRFWDAKAWAKAHAKGKLPPSFDKQFVREWGKKHGIDKLEPEEEKDIALVDSLEVPPSVTEMTTRIYRYIFWRLTGLRIETYQQHVLDINTPPPRRKIEILLGSRSDLDQAKEGLNTLDGKADAKVSILSCHRNFALLAQVARDRLSKADIVIAGAGMAAQLSGMIKSALCAIGRSDIPVIGVGFQGQSERENHAATLSIECLPGQPVELNPVGKAHFGPVGFKSACLSATNDEFLPRTIETKPAEFDIRQIS